MQNPMTTPELFSWRRPVADGELMLVPGNKLAVGFVMNSWLESFRNSFHVAGVPNDVYYANWHDILELIIPRSVVLILVNANDPDQFLGYIVYEKGAAAIILHYVYVKKPFRNMGFARAMVETMIEHEADPHNKDNWNQPIIQTHRTKASADMFKTKRDYEMRNWRYDPFWLYRSLGW